MSEPIRPYPFSGAGLRAALFDLGPDVAETLRDMGIRGERNCPGRCPIANYILTVVEEVSSASVDLIESYAWNDMRKTRIEVSNPAIVRDFIQEFDERAYPELEVPSAA